MNSFLVFGYLELLTSVRNGEMDMNRKNCAASLMVLTLNIVQMSQHHMEGGAPQKLHFEREE